MMSTPTSRSNKFPFTATQWQELEHQALIYKYMVAGIPIPPDLLFSINRNLDPSLSSKLFPTYQTSPIGWNPYQMAYGGKKIDPEPGRCRRTDGKKWRCSKEAYPDSKYCERHMHRGKNRSRKPVEVMAAAAAATGVNHNQAAAAMLPGNTPIISPSFSVSKLQNANSSSSSSSSFHPLQSTYQSASDTSFHYGGRCHGNSSFDSNFLYPHSSSSRPPGGTDQDSILYDSASFSRDRYLHGVKEDVAVGEHAFFTESSGAARRDMQSGYPSYVDDMSSKQKQAWGREFGSCEASSMEEVKREISEPRKTIHHFFDEWPPKGSRDSSPWHDSSTTQLSISIPTSSHDLFLSASTPHNDG